MSEYSEKQLLMLSNFVYLPCSLNAGSISEIINMYRDENGVFTEQSVAMAGAGGGLKASDIKILFEEMDKESSINPSFGKLSAVRKLNGGYVKAICYADEKNENAVVAFRGTGGSTNAWVDNFEGGYEEDSSMQKLAADFVRNECAIYSDITVTGHSKGGNMSQYVTVMCAQQVSRCVSFDGQGFNQTFIDKNKSRIDIASPKIKSISAYNDYVNILLTCIAGSVVYAENDNSIANAHSSFSLLERNSFDMNGNLISDKKQSLVMKTLDKLTDMLVQKIDKYDNSQKSMLSYITGKTIATALTSEDELRISNTLGTVSGGVTALMVKSLADMGAFENSNITLEVRELYFDDAGIMMIIDNYEATKISLYKVKMHIEEVNERISKHITVRLYSERMLMKVCGNLDTIINRINTLITALETIRLRYVEKEKLLSQSY